MMNSTSSKPKAASRWGSLLQGAVAGLESRLDTILAEDATLAARNSRPHDKSASASKKEPDPAQDGQADPHDKGFDASRNHKTERPLQRFTKSIIEASPQSIAVTQILDHENHPMRSESSFATSNTSSDSPTRADPHLIALNDVNEKASNIDNANETDTLGAREPEHITHAGDGEVSGNPAVVLPTSNGFDTLDQEKSLGRPLLQQLVDTGNSISASIGLPNTEMQDGLSQDIENEEVHRLLERIDALQAKVRILAKDAEDSAKRAAAQAPRGSLEKQLAEKSSQVALLMQEGEKLSKAEVNQTALIKRLRRKIGDDEKALTEVRHALSKTGTALSRSQADLQGLHLAQKDANEKLASIPVLEREIETYRHERASREATVTGLRQKIELLQTQIDNENALAKSRAVSAETQLVSDLRKELDNARNEKLAAEETAIQERINLEAELEHEKEKSRFRETSLRTELSLLESKFEFYRSRSEEASFTGAEDGQTNMVRQIETLQHQYAVASENWQGIEGSLLSQVAECERERDEAQRQELETRKKVREANSKVRSLQETLDKTLRRTQSLEEEAKSQKHIVSELRTQAQKATQNLKATRENFARERQEWDETLSTRIEEERQKLRTEFGPQPISRTTSPLGSRKLTNLDVSGSTGRKILARNMPTEPIIPIADLLDRSSSRRGSNMPPQTQDMLQTNGTADRVAARYHETRSRTPSMPGNAPETPSVQAAELDDPLDHRSSPHRTVNDVLSGSPVHAGPSVQLVERMSAAVRRLENEKAVTKDEIERLSAQRDDARQEIVSLMREVEHKRTSEARTAQMEAELEELRHRHQTTLELLGEKSEQVEELRADVADLKKIYRDLVERSLT